MKRLWLILFVLPLFAQELEELNEQIAIVRYEGAEMNDYLTIAFSCADADAYCPDFDASEMMGVNNHPGYDFINDNNELLGRWFEIKWVNKNIQQYAGEGSMDFVLEPADVMLSVKMLDLYSVSSKNGLNVRDKPSTSGNNIGVLNYNSLVNIVSKTGMELTIDDNDTDIDITKIISGQWVKIESLYQGKSTSANIISGYVFDGYLSKLSTRITQEKYKEQAPIILDESEQGTFNWCMASGGKDLTPSYNAPKKCVYENKVYEDSCVGNDKYFVISADRTDDVGTDILVKYKSSSSQNISCEYLKNDKDFEIKDEGAAYIMALENNFLILDEGTGPFPRGLIIYDLSSRKKVLEDSYLEPVNIKNNIINYWTETTIKANEENCSTYKLNEENFMGSAIETRVSLDLLTLAKKELGEYRCSATQ